MLAGRPFLSVARLSAGFLSPKCRAGRGWQDALSLAHTGDYLAISLDCFDTLLVREDPDWEQRIVAEIAGANAGYSSQQSQNMLRVAHERAQGLSDGDREPSAASIWLQFCIGAGLPEQVASRMSAHELSLLEVASLASNDALSFVAEIEGLGLPWIVCSDTRWSAGQLSVLLQHKGFAIPPESVFSSSDHGRSKFRGGLYPIAHRHVVEALGKNVPPSAILHVGDNFLADNCSAACYGMQTVNVPRAPRQTKQIVAGSDVHAYLDFVRRDVSADNPGSCPN
jgi:FMN phosphatase YigB (HAD superfamily)